jgi:hypothetical protein
MVLDPRAIADRHVLSHETALPQHDAAPDARAGHHVAMLPDPRIFADDRPRVDDRGRVDPRQCGRGG